MAYDVLVSLTQTIDRILQDHDQYSISLQDKQHIISIHEYSIFLQAFLEDFPEKAHSLEGKIRDVAAKAEDIIEDLVLEHIRQHYISKSQSEGQNEVGPNKAEDIIQHIRRHCISKVRSVMCKSSKRKKRHLFDSQDQLEKVTGEIDSIAREVMEIKNIAKSTDHSSVATSSSSLRVVTASTGKDIAMVGFEDDLLAIKERLCGESPKLEVIPIFGMGGIGKTTLARNAYDDPLTVEYFQIRAWVTISQGYSAPNILSKLLVSVGAGRCEESDESKMAENVYKSLKGRRYLIVMDDMWEKKVWDDVRRILPDDRNGSRIVLTTRLSDVAAYPDSSSSLHEMRFMDPDQSWNLLCRRVFKQEECPLELENIGKEIARRCRGLPLAIVVIAGLLSTVEAGKSRAYWEKIAKNVNEVVATNDEQFANVVLSLSYNHLPQHLKPCFLYMGGLPEDYVIRVSKLIKLYVAEGFLKLRNGYKSCEETAEEYLEDLVKRSLVLVNRRKSNGKIKSCSVHDLVRNLCIRKAQEEKFFLHLTDRHDPRILPKSLKDTRRLSIRNDFDPNVPLKETYDPTSVRTVLYFKQCESLSGISENFRFLRVLDAMNIRFNKFPVEVLKLLHLRYLAFACQKGIEFHVPASIVKLENLQILFISPYFKTYEYERHGVRFPSEIWRMSQLRHIVIFNLESLPNPDHALENLQTLAQITNFRCTERIVQMIPNLKKLSILYNGKYGINWRPYQLHNLVQMHQLEELKIWVKDQDCNICFWKNLAFPMRLKKLNLSGFRFGVQDIAIVGSLPNLQVLKLRSCSFEEHKWITNEREFCQLKFLQISDGILRHWITESGHFPRLEHLRIYRCRLLHEIPDGIGEIPTLELIEIVDRKESLVESAKRIQEEQQSMGNDTLQVRVVRL